MNNNRAIVPVSTHHHSNKNGGSNRIMTSNSVASNLAGRRQGTASSTRPGTANSVRVPPSTLLCNLCQKPLATTCFLCACDCIFCEECTYSHFEQSSQCPICQRTLTENDFTELVIADATTHSTADIAKTSLQALFSKQSKSQLGNVKGLPYADLCFSLIRQIDVVKQSTKFLLKQLLMNSNSQSRKVAIVFKHNEKLKSDITFLKQAQSSQRIQYEQINNDLKNRLNARESRIQELNMKLTEKEKMLQQFRLLHRGGDASGGNEQGYHHPVPPSSNRHHHDTQDRGNTGSDGHRNRHKNNQFSVGNDSAASIVEPPLKGLMMQRQAQQIARQESFMSTRRGPNISSSSSGFNRGNFQQQSALSHLRPFSSNNSISSNSITSTTPRIRDLSYNTGFNFTAGSGNSTTGSGNGGQQRLNKRRRAGDNAATPASVVMSPNTAFTLNQGAHTVNRGPRWLQKDGRND